MSKQQRESTEAFIQRARARIEGMEQAAQELTDKLGLPVEARYDVLALLLREQPHEILAQPLEKSAALTSPALSETDGNRNGRWRLHGQQPDMHRSRLQKTAAPLMAILCATLLVSSLVIVTHIAQKSKGNTSTMASVADPSGMYVSTTSGIYRLDERKGKLVQRWFYGLSAPWTTQIVNGMRVPIGFDMTAFNSRVDTPVTVSGDLAYVGGSEDDPVTHQLHHYLYALNAADGTLRWRYQTDGAGTGISGPITDSAISLTPGKIVNGPFVWHDTVYIDVHSNESSDHTFNDAIVALQQQDGSVEWTYRYQGSEGSATDGMGTLANGEIYGAAERTIFALDAQNGKQQWSQALPQQEETADQALQAPCYSAGQLYASSSINGNPNQKSIIYAFDAKNGRNLWHSQQFDYSSTAPTVEDGILYAGTWNGRVLALHANNGTELWHYDSGETITAAPQAMNGAIYVKSISGNAGTSNRSEHLLALDSHQGKRLWTRTFPTAISQWGNDSNALITHDGFIYTGIHQGDAYIVRADNGTIVQSYHLDNSQASQETMDLALAA